MKGFNSKLWIITSLAFVALLSLLLLQTRLLNQSIETNRQVFRQKVDIISQKVGESFRAKENVAHELPVCVHDDPQGKLDALLREIIGEVLNQYNLPIDFHYGIYRHDREQANLFELVKGSSNVVPLQVNHGCLNGCDNTFGMISLTCGHFFGELNKFHLAIFLDEDGYVLSAGTCYLTISALLVFLICLAFGYLIYMLRKQKRVAEIKSDFINNLTHEFKTPIFSIELASGILRKSEELKTSDKLMGFLKLIGTETQRLKTQVDKVLQMALVDSGNFKLEKEPTDLNELIRNLVQHFELIVGEKEGSIRLNLKATSAIINADPVHLKNVLNNLVDNAIKYSNSPPSITISTGDAANGICLSVCDTGIGMSKEVQRLVFQRFYRAQHGNVYTAKGFGLGLSYVKQIIEAHNGSIVLKSAERLGSEFTIYLPA